MTLRVSSLWRNAKKQWIGRLLGTRGYPAVKGIQTEPHTFLKDQAALVTGGASGIGKEVCKLLLQKGCKICIADNNMRVGRMTKREFEQENSEFEGRILVTSCDVTSDRHFRNAVQKAIKYFGHLDILINNAGIIDENNWEHTVNVNLNGVIRGTLHGLQYLKNKAGYHGGCIINTAAMTGTSSGAVTPAFIASKHGVVGWSRCWGNDEVYKLTGVRVNCILPEHTNTPLMDMWLEGTIDDKQAREKFITMLKDKLIQPVDVAEAFIKLLEEGVNGALLVVSYDKGCYYVPYEKFIFF